MKLDLICVKTKLENWQLDMILRERDYERRSSLPVRQSFYRGLGIGILLSCAAWGMLYWKFCA